MKIEIVPKKKYSIISYISLLIGILCLLFVFITPTRIANVGNIVGDYITIALTGVGIILSSSFFIFWIITIILLFTGQINFAP
ncbi:hypothetical protein [Bacillus toyonensis]|uniref:hypothetical protein n=1 Tax=Bacillus toyonensis TaxID=155322 RepID=UPI000BF12EDA|nr:hypothetical protein [Bacillus toyonensis]PEM48289.1 hypothetical protein CN636_02920 [Bacillus toyonensis]